MEEYSKNKNSIEVNWKNPIMQRSNIADINFGMKSTKTKRVSSLTRAAKTAPGSTGNTGWRWTSHISRPLVTTKLRLNLKHLIPGQIQTLIPIHEMICSPASCSCWKMNTSWNRLFLCVLKRNPSFTWGRYDHKNPHGQIILFIASQSKTKLVWSRWLLTKMRFKHKFVVEAQVFLFSFVGTEKQRSELRLKKVQHPWAHANKNKGCWMF